MRHLFLVVLFNFAFAHFEKDLTFEVRAGKQECFYHNVSIGETIDIEYQVIDASHAEFEIAFIMSDPVGLMLATDFRKTEYSHRHVATLTGDYRFCFDNTFSTFSDKTVFFDLLIVNEALDEPEDYDDDKVMDLEGASPAETYQMKVRDISESVHRIQSAINRAQRQQDIHAAHEARDRNLAEDVCARVLTWSLFQILFMLFVGITQVFFLKSLFDSDCSIKKYVSSFRH